MDQSNLQLLEARAAPRFHIKALVQVVRGRERFAAGDLIDISVTGAAFRAYTPLSMGQKYSLVVEGVGAFPCRLVRSNGATEFGVAFELSPLEERSLYEKLCELA